MAIWIFDALLLGLNQTNDEEAVQILHCRIT